MSQKIEPFLPLAESMGAAYDKTMDYRFVGRGEVRAKAAGFVATDWTRGGLTLYQRPKPVPPEPVVEAPAAPAKKVSRGAFFKK